MYKVEFQKTLDVVGRDGKECSYEFFKKMELDFVPFVGMITYNLGGQFNYEVETVEYDFKYKVFNVCLSPNNVHEMSAVDAFIAEGWEKL